MSERADLWTIIEVHIGPHASLPGWDVTGNIGLSALSDQVAELVMTAEMPEGADPSVSGILNGPAPSWARDEPEPGEEWKPEHRYPGWPDWLTAEYGAIHTRIVNAMKQGAQSCYDSADAAGMPWTSGGMLSVQASRIIGQLRSDGWEPPVRAMTAVAEIPDPKDLEYAGDMFDCDGCGEAFEYLTDRPTVDGTTIELCETCLLERDDKLIAEVRELRARLAATIV